MNGADDPGIADADTDADADADADGANEVQTANGEDKAQTWRKPQIAMAMVTVKPDVLLKLLAFLLTI